MKDCETVEVCVTKASMPMLENLYQERDFFEHSFQKYKTFFEISDAAVKEISQKRDFYKKTAIVSILINFVAVAVLLITSIAR